MVFELSCKLERESLSCVRWRHGSIVIGWCLLFARVDGCPSSIERGAAYAGANPLHYGGANSLVACHTRPPSVERYTQTRACKASRAVGSCSCANAVSCLLEAITAGT